MKTSVRILFLPLPIAAVTLALPAPERIKEVRFPNPVPVGLSTALAVSEAPPHTSWEDAYVRARTQGERVRTGVEPGEERREYFHLQALVSVLARHPQAIELPWHDWLLENRRRFPEFTLELFRGARSVYGSEIMPIAQELDEKYAPRDLRVEVLRTIWAYDYMEGRNRTYQILFKETLRNNSTVKADLVREVLAGLPGLEVEQLLTKAIRGNDGVGRYLIDELTQREAIRALRERNNPETATNVAGEMIALYRGEQNNLSVRMEAFMAAVDLDLRQAMPYLKGEKIIPNEQIQMQEFMASIRRELQSRM